MGRLAHKGTIVQRGIMGKAPCFGARVIWMRCGCLLDMCQTGNEGASSPADAISVRELQIKPYAGGMLRKVFACVCSWVMQVQ